MTQNFNLFQFCRTWTTKTRVILGRLKGKYNFLDYLWNQSCVIGILVAVVDVLTYSQFLLPSPPSSWLPCGWNILPTNCFGVCHVTCFYQWNVDRRVEVLNWGFKTFWVFPLTRLCPAITHKKSTSQAVTIPSAEAPVRDTGSRLIQTLSLEWLQSSYRPMSKK